MLVLEICNGTVCTVEVYVVFLDTLTPVFKLYVRLRERRQRAASHAYGCAVACSAFVVGGVVLVGLYCYLALLYGCGAAVGPFLRDCEIESSSVVLMTNVGSLSLGRGVRALFGCCEPEVLAQTVHRFTGCERDKVGRRILNVTVICAVFSAPPFWDKFGSSAKQSKKLCSTGERVVVAIFGDVGFGACVSTWHGPTAVWSAGVVLVGLYCSLALLYGCGAAVGPFVHDCETESEPPNTHSKDLQWPEEGSPVLCSSSKDRRSEDSSEEINLESNSSSELKDLLQTSAIRS
ncbi:hypothetical protein Taro_038402 [Colocasia esculenta]|uniref:Uncharacterized protein n=1 Tax=Colocasia esculenta TaxID=4460 RepID=A0A843WSL9_COLES|nr:hypothetical protein [Colocasia esculenta]